MLNAMETSLDDEERREKKEACLQRVMIYNQLKEKEESKNGEWKKIRIRLWEREANRFNFDL